MDWIKQKVNNLTKRYHTNNPFKLASALNIKITPWDFHDEILGMYIYERRSRYILYNRKLENDINMRNFIIAHELGHAILHTKLNTPFLREKTFYSTDRIEKEANRFAVELLMPDSFLYEFKNEGITIYEAAQIYGIPREFAELKKY
ncbi:MAG TPA: ImmA/IrrE family metallo-endopeptidase [Firmicutes bacterium]|nr:ImmA/IrrE family metallo-endopeptidase [Bacillota bacterium]